MPHLHSLLSFFSRLLLFLSGPFSTACGAPWATAPAAGGGAQVLPPPSPSGGGGGPGATAGGGRPPGHCPPPSRSDRCHTSNDSLLGGGRGGATTSRIRRCQSSKRSLAPGGRPPPPLPGPRAAHALPGCVRDGKGCPPHRAGRVAPAALRGLVGSTHRVLPRPIHPVLERGVELEHFRPLGGLLRGERVCLSRTGHLLDLLANVLVGDELVRVDLPPTARASAVVDGGVRDAVDDAVAAERGPATGREDRLPKNLVAERALQRLLHARGAGGESGDDLLLDGVAHTQLLVLLRRLMRVDVVAGVPWEREGHAASALLLALLHGGDFPQELAWDALGGAHLLHEVGVIVRGAVPDPVALLTSAHHPAPVASVVGGRRFLDVLDRQLVCIQRVVACLLARVAPDGEAVGPRVPEHRAA